MCKRDRRAIKALLVIVLLFFMVWFSIPMTATRVYNSVVMVHIYQRDYMSGNYSQRGMASGVVIDDGIILTAKHVIDDADKIIITTADGIELVSKEFVEADDIDLGLIIFYDNDMHPSSRIS